MQKRTLGEGLEVSALGLGVVFQALHRPRVWVGRYPGVGRDVLELRPSQLPADYPGRERRLQVCNRAQVPRRRDKGSRPMIFQSSLLPSLSTASGGFDSTSSQRRAA